MIPTALFILKTNIRRRTRHGLYILFSFSFSFSSLLSLTITIIRRIDFPLVDIGANLCFRAKRQRIRPIVRESLVIAVAVIVGSGGGARTDRG